MWSCRNAIRGVLGTAGLIALSACGSGLTDPGAVPTYGDATIANELVALPRWKPWIDFTDIASLGLPFTFEGARRECQAVNSGTSTTNAAGVPTDLQQTYLCNRQLEGAVSTLEGSVRVQAQGDAYAARVTYTRLKHTLFTLGGTTEQTLNGTMEVKLLDPRTLQMTDDIVEEYVGPGAGVMRARRFVRTFSDTVALRLATTWTTAVMRFDGNYSFAHTQFPGDTLHLAVTTPVPIVRAIGDCASQFKAGEIEATRRNTTRAPVRVRLSC